MDLSNSVTHSYCEIWTLHRSLCLEVCCVIFVELLLMDRTSWKLSFLFPIRENFKKQSKIETHCPWGPCSPLKSSGRRGQGRVVLASDRALTTWYIGPLQLQQDLILQKTSLGVMAWQRLFLNSIRHEQWAPDFIVVAHSEFLISFCLWGLV